MTTKPTQPNGSPDTKANPVSRPFYHASMETRNFDFAGYGVSKEEALTTLYDALRIHANQYQLPRDWFVGNDINVTEYQFGIPYRDRENLNQISNASDPVETPSHR